MTTPFQNNTIPSESQDSLISKNSIIEKFASNDVLIIQTKNAVGDNINWIRANDIAKILDIKYIHRSIQKYDKDEKGCHDCQTPGGIQNMIFLTSDGVYRLLFNSIKPEAKKFRKWACKILNDVNFNNSQEIKQALPALESKILQEDLYNETCFYVRIQLPEKYKSTLSKEKDLTLNVIKPGITYSLRKRNSGYNDELTDNGYFIYSFSMNSRVEAEIVEKIYKMNFKEFTVYGSTEYFDTTLLAKRLKFEEFVPNCYDSYLKLAKVLFDHIVELVKFNFPGYDNHYGYCYDIEEKNETQQRLTLSGSLDSATKMITTNRREITKEPELLSEAGNFLYIGHNHLIKNKLKIGVTVDEFSIIDCEALFIFESKLSNEISKLVTHLLSPYALSKLGWFKITYDDMKRIVDFSINTYEKYKINDSTSNLIEFISRYKSNSLAHLIQDVYFSENIYQQFIKDNVVFGENLKVSTGYIYDDFYKWINDNKIQQKYLMKIENGNWSGNFQREVIKNFEKLTGKVKSTVNMNTRGIKFSNCSGFKGFELKSMPNEIEFFNEMVYTKYISEHFTVTGDNRNKISRNELLPDFSEWSKLHDFTPKKNIFYKKSFSANFSNLLIQRIESALNIKFDQSGIKQDSVGCFIGVSHKNFPFKAHFANDLTENERIKKILKDWKTVDSKIGNVFKTLLAKEKLSNDEVKKLLNSKDAYLQRKRNNYHLIFSKKDDKFWYLSDLTKTLYKEILDE